MKSSNKLPEFLNSVSRNGSLAFLRLVDYSYRKATIGSIRVARRAGR